MSAPRAPSWLARHSACAALVGLHACSSSSPSPPAATSTPRVVAHASGCDEASRLLADGIDLLHGQRLARGLALLERAAAICPDHEPATYAGRLGALEQTSRPDLARELAARVLEDPRAPEAAQVLARHALARPESRKPTLADVWGSLAEGRAKRDVDEYGVAQSRFDRAAGELVRAGFEPPHVEIVAAPEALRQSSSPSGALDAVADATDLLVVEAATQIPIARIARTSVTGASFFGDRYLAVTKSGGGLIGLDLDSGDFRDVLAGAAGRKTTLVPSARRAVSQDAVSARLLAIGDKAPRSEAGDSAKPAETEGVLAELRGARLATLSHDGKSLAVVGGPPDLPRTTITILSTETGAVLHELEPDFAPSPTNTIVGLHFDPGGETFAASSLSEGGETRRTSVQTFLLPSGERKKAWDLRFSASTVEYAAPGILGVCCASDTSAVRLLGGPRDEILHIDARSGRITPPPAEPIGPGVVTLDMSPYYWTRWIAKGPLATVAFARDARRALFGNVLVDLHDAAHPKDAIVPIGSEKSAVSRVALRTQYVSSLSLDGRWLAEPGPTTQLWDVDRREARQLRAEALVIAMSADASVVATGPKLEIRSERRIVTVPENALARDIDVGDDGQYVAWSMGEFVHLEDTVDGSESKVRAEGVDRLQVGVGPIAFMRRYDREAKHVLASYDFAKKAWRQYPGLARDLTGPYVVAPDGRIATGDGPVVRLMDVSTDGIAELRGVTGDVTAIAFGLGSVVAVTDAGDGAVWSNAGELLARIDVAPVPGFVFVRSPGGAFEVLGDGAAHVFCQSDALLFPIELCGDRWQVPGLLYRALRGERVDGPES